MLYFILLCLAVIAVDSGLKAMELLQLNKQKSQPESPASNVGLKVLFFLIDLCHIPAIN
jgi:hypothetical protein